MMTQFQRECVLLVVVLTFFYGYFVCAETVHIAIAAIF
jgi:hypothetical protein